MNDSKGGNRKKPSLAYIFVAVCVFILVGFYLGNSIFNKTSMEITTYARILLGTVVEITLWEDNTTAVEEAFKEVDRLEQIFSSYKPTSDVSKIARGAGSKGEQVSEEVIQVIDIALKVATLSDGAFDPTIGALSSQWDFSGDADKVPSESELAAAAALVDYKNIFVDRENSIVGLRKKNSRINLGGIAKGYIVGEAIKKLKARGIPRAIIRAGGDMFFYQINKGNGQETPSRQFTIGIQHPRKQGELLGRLHVTGGQKGTAVSTSGDYERFFIIDKTRYHHIINPKTGYPATGCRSVTIVSTDPTLADALSTAVFVMGPGRGMELIESLDEIEGIIVDSTGEITMSTGLNEKYKFVRLDG